MRRLKYNNKHTEYNGRVYASKAEARRAQELDLLKRAGEIYRWFPQTPYPLYGKNGNVVCVHIVDFHVFTKDKEWVEDVKGVRTALWSLKRKLFLDNYPEIEYKVIK